MEIVGAENSGNPKADGVSLKRRCEIIAFPQTPCICFTTRNPASLYAFGFGCWLFRPQAQAPHWSFTQSPTIFASGVVAYRKMWAESYNFPTDSCKLPMEDITGAQNLNFAPYFFERGISSPKFCTFRRKFSDKKIFR